MIRRWFLKTFYSDTALARFQGVTIGLWIAIFIMFIKGKRA